MNIKDIKNKIIYNTISGSHAYGLNTPQSDVDTRGIFLLKNDNLLTLNNYVNQVSDDTNDTIFYELNRYAELLHTNNPNILELLYIPKDKIIEKSPVFDNFIKHRDEFLSKLCKNTFGGYSISQIKKARGLNKKIVNPVDKEKKTPIDFSYLTFKGGSINLRKWLKGQKDVNMQNQSNYGLQNINNMKDVYNLYYREDGIYAGIINKDETSNTVRLSSIPKGEKPIGVLYFNLDGYSMYCKKYKEYWDWVDKRNEHRYNSNINSGASYDCYLDEETEYLTDYGWFKFDDVKDYMKLGSVDSSHRLIFQTPTEKIKKEYSGKIITYEDRYTKFSVTPNHNLYLSKFYRNNNDKNSRIYNEENSNWNFITAENFLKQKGDSHYISHIKPNPNKNNIIPLYWYFIAGAYLGDGCILRNKKGIIREIRISQLETKPLFNKLEELGLKKYFSKTTKGGNNWVFSITNKEIISFIVDNFGIGSFNKDIPLNIINNLSDEEFNLLFEGLILSDGTTNKNGFKTYYSRNKKLIDSIQLLLFTRGIYCQIYEYDDDSGYTKKISKEYYLSIPEKLNKTYRVLQKNKCKVKSVENKIITCFTVPNNILITRNNEKIAIQGNTKNLMHCVRLLDSAIYIGKYGTLKIEPENKELLFSIKYGKLPYDDIMKMVEDKKQEMDEVFDSSDLPESVDINKINELILEIRYK